MTVRKSVALLCAILIASASVALFPGVALAATLYVSSANCPGPGTGTIGNPYCSLQTAVNNASAGDTIIVTGGTHSATVNKILRIEVQTTVTVTGGTVTGAAGRGLDILNDGNFSVTGGTFSSNGTGLRVENNGTLAVSGATFSSNSTGLEVEDNGASTITGNTFTGNNPVHVRDILGGVLNLTAIRAANTFDGSALGTNTINWVAPPSPPPAPAPVPGPESTPSYRFMVESEGGGSISIDPPWIKKAGTVNEGVDVKLAAIPDPCWEFSHWEIGRERRENFSVTLFFQMKKDIRAKAIFLPLRYSLVVETEGEGNMGISPGVHEFKCGTGLQLKAVPDKFWAFSHWHDLPSDSAERKDPNRFVVIDRNQIIRAVFIRTFYNIEVWAEDPGTVDQEGTHLLRPGGTLILYANPPDGYTCRWKGPVAHPDRCATYIVADDDHVVTATFERKTSPSPPLRSLVVEKMGEGVVWTEPRGNSFHYPEGARVLLVAAPMNGWWFDRWVINESEGSTSPRITLALRGDYRVIAIFRQWEDWQSPS